ncbi:MAG TPA: endonuclease V [Nitrososphaerales archaeon]|nr:endonuclease V [Nitrososphaerales archaeon]
MKAEIDPAEVAFFTELQRILSRGRILLPGNLSRICAVDAAYSGDLVVAVASLFEDGTPAETSTYIGRCTFPYVSGLFFLREGPFAVEAISGLKSKPQLVCFDAHGEAHPRLAGMATICGMVLGMPSVGIAKSLLVGKVVQAREGLDEITHGGRRAGFRVRTDGMTRYWSPGYSVDLSQLESVICTHGSLCLRAMADSDRVAREELRAATSPQP